MKTEIRKSRILVPEEKMNEIFRHTDEADCKNSYIVSCIRDKDISEPMARAMAREYIESNAQIDQYMRDTCDELLNDNHLRIYRWEIVERGVMDICAEYEVIE